MTTARSLAGAAAMVALAWAPALALDARAQPAPAMPGMPAGPMEHPAGSPPFYRERTFLVLVGVGVAAAGLAAYRVGRARHRRRPGPTSFVSEAVLVVDLVDSTHLATHYGEALAMRARNALKDRALAAAGPRGVGFTENTGDGCLMTFPSVAGAAETAIVLLRDLRDRPPDLSPAPPLDVRAGISYGEILLDARGGRHGAAINKAFRLEALSWESFARVGHEEPPARIPERNRLFIDEEAARELRRADVPHRLVGFCSLKGFSGLHQVYEVLLEPETRSR
ncbi:MAG: adenylate/guanylate cyclase domain-containing protein [Candidatus Rokubacteria bacterium]|nr:adenylate/guanylate cyclase domain-containing protein [Candidatus Rokubacteria bacterium]